MGLVVRLVGEADEVGLHLLEVLEDGGYVLVVVDADVAEADVVG